MNQTIKISENVLSQVVDDEMVLLDLNNENYFGLNQVGVKIWELLEQGKTADEIVPVLLSEFDADEQQIRSDVDELLEQLSERGLIEVTPDVTL